jgi:hypothetical protein
MEAPGDSGMKTYYGVYTEFYDNGMVKARLQTRQAKTMPKNQARELPFMDAYIDWFRTRGEAEKFLAEAKRA